MLAFAVKVKINIKIIVKFKKSYQSHMPNFKPFDDLHRIWQTFRHMKIKKPEVHFVIKNILDRK